MIQINSIVIPELEGCTSFGFKTRTRKKEKRSLKHRSSEEHLGQNKAVSDILVALEKFALLPCKVSIEVGSQDGSPMLFGEINAYDQSSMDESQLILSKVDFLNSQFSRSYPRSSFSIQFSQSVTITRVDRYQVH